MAIYRSIHLSFWTDSKVNDDFTPEDKYFFLYLLTNPHTNLCGCYEVSVKQMGTELGYSIETVERLLERMERVHNIIRYSKSTKEVMILHWDKYNWNSSPKFQAALTKELECIKDTAFREYITLKLHSEDTVGIGYPYPMDTTVTVTDTDIYKDIDTKVDITTKLNNKSYIEYIKEIVSYLNQVCGTNYRYQSAKTQSLIKARLKEGFSLDDFRSVIDKKFAEWGNNPEMSNYLRPETLFGTKFESYLNQKSTGRKKSLSEEVDEWLSQRQASEK